MGIGWRDNPGFYPRVDAEYPGGSPLTPWPPGGVRRSGTGSGRSGTPWWDRRRTLTAARNVCDSNVGRRPGSGLSPTVGFRCPEDWTGVSGLLPSRPGSSTDGRRSVSRCFRCPFWISFVAEVAHCDSPLRLPEHHLRNPVWESRRCKSWWPGRSGRLRLDRADPGEQGRPPARLKRPGTTGDWQTTTGSVCPASSHILETSTCDATTIQRRKNCHNGPVSVWCQSLASAVWGRRKSLAVAPSAAPCFPRFLGHSSRDSLPCCYTVKASHLSDSKSKSIHPQVPAPAALSVTHRKLDIITQTRDVLLSNSQLDKCCERQTTWDYVSNRTSSLFNAELKTFVIQVVSVTSESRTDQ